LLLLLLLLYMEKSLYYALPLQGARVIAVPSAFTRPTGGPLNFTVAGGAC